MGVNIKLKIKFIKVKNITNILVKSSPNLKGINCQ